MSRVNSRLQVTLPKAVAERCGIRPGDYVRFEESGGGIRVVKANAQAPGRQLSTEERLRLFKEATARQKARETERPLSRSTTRGWTRDELYARGDGPNTD